MKTFFNILLAAAGVLFILFASVFLKGSSLAPVDSNAAGNIVFKQDISYGTLPKQKLDLCEPRNIKGKVPGIIIIHGGGGDKSQHTSQCKKFAQNGFVAVVVNYREDPAPSWKVVLGDNEKALVWLRSQKEVDGAKIGAFGASMGGYVASMIGVNEEVGKAECVANNFGPTDFTDTNEWEESPLMDEAAQQFFGVPYDENPELYKQLSAITYVDASDAASWLFTRSTNDHLVPRTQMTKMVDALENVGMKTEVYEYDGRGGGHANNLPPLQALHLLNKRINFMTDCLNSL